MGYNLELKAYRVLQHQQYLTNCTFQLVSQLFRCRPVSFNKRIRAINYVLIVISFEFFLIYRNSEITKYVAFYSFRKPLQNKQVYKTICFSHIWFTSFKLIYIKSHVPIFKNKHRSKYHYLIIILTSNVNSLDLEKNSTLSKKKKLKI